MPYWRLLSQLWHATRRQALLLLSGLVLATLSAESAPNLYPRLLQQDSLTTSFFNLLKHPNFWVFFKSAWLDHPFLAATMVVFSLAALVVFYSLLVLAQNYLHSWTNQTNWRAIQNNFKFFLNINIIFTVLLAILFATGSFLISFVADNPWARYVVLISLIILFISFYSCRRLCLAYVQNNSNTWQALKDGLSFFRRSPTLVLKTFFSFQIITIITLSLLEAVGFLVGTPATRLAAFFAATGWTSAARSIIFLSSTFIFVVMAWSIAKISSLEWLVWLSLPGFSPKRK